MIEAVSSSGIVPPCKCQQFDTVFFSYYDIGANDDDWRGKEVYCIIWGWYAARPPTPCWTCRCCSHDLTRSSRWATMGSARNVSKSQSVFERSYFIRACRTVRSLIIAIFVNKSRDIFKVTHFRQGRAEVAYIESIMNWSWCWWWYIMILFCW